MPPSGIENVIYYNPLLQVCAHTPQVLTFYYLFEYVLAQDAAQLGVQTFNGTGPNINICYFTWMCSILPLPFVLAIHADSKGYALIADSLEALTAAAAAGTSPPAMSPGATRALHAGQLAALIRQLR